MRLRFSGVVLCEPRRPPPGFHKGGRSNILRVPSVLFKLCLETKASLLHVEAAVGHSKRITGTSSPASVCNTCSSSVRRNLVCPLQEGAQSASVRELIQNIENHPNRHALQRDLQQNQSFNPFSQESKQMIKDVGNIELCELLDTEPKAQCKVCLSNWDIGIVYCT